MKGPYTWTASIGGAPGQGDIVSVKRDAIRDVRRAVKALGVVDQVGARGEMRDRDGDLVRQVEAYRTPGGAVKVRELEL